MAVSALCLTLRNRAEGVLPHFQKNQKGNCPPQGWVRRSAEREGSESGVRPSAKLFDRWQWTGWRSGAVAELADVRPQLVPGVTFRRQQSVRPRRTNAYQVL